MVFRLDREVPLSSVSGSAGDPSPHSDPPPPAGPDRDPSSNHPPISNPQAASEKTRKTLAYCSATDRNVPVLVKLARNRSRRKRPSYREAERLVCLDYGVRCTGWLCPLFDVPTLSEDVLEESPHRRPT